MKITRRARRRIILLFTCLFVGTGILLSAWYVRKVQKENAAVQARVEGLAAAEEGDWALALGSLSRAVAFDKFDIEALISFAEARSRIPQENNRHFARAMNLFSRASDLARVDQQVDLLEQALTGQARMELATGSLARLQDTSRELLELDPENRTAIEYLFEMSRIRGNLLPRGRDGADETQFLIRGARSNAEWLAALRDVDEGVEEHRGPAHRGLEGLVEVRQVMLAPHGHQLGIHARGGRKHRLHGPVHHRQEGVTPKEIGF